MAEATDSQLVQLRMFSCSGSLYDPEVTARNQAKCPDPMGGLVVTHMQSRLLYHVQIRPTRIGEHKRAVAKPLEHQLFDLLLSSGWPHKSSWIRIPCLQ